MIAATGGASDSEHIKKIADLLGRGGSKTAEADAEAIAE